MPLDPPTSAQSAGVYAGTAADEPLVFEFYENDGTYKQFFITVEDMQKADPAAWNHWFNKIWNSICDYFSGPRVAGAQINEANTFFHAAVSAKDDVTKAKNYFALKAMATLETQRTRFSEVYNATTGLVTLGIEARLGKGPGVAMTVEASALPSEAIAILDLPQDVMTAALEREAKRDSGQPVQANSVEGGVAPVCTTTHQFDGTAYLTDWANRVCTLPDKEILEDPARERGAAAPRLQYWLDLSNFEPPVHGQCVYELELNDGLGPATSKNVWTEGADVAANLEFANRLHRAQTLTPAQVNSTAFLMLADNSVQELMNEAAARDPRFDRSANGWMCKNNFSISHHGTHMVMSITSESQLSDEQLHMDTGAGPDAPLVHQEVTYRQKWVITPDGQMRCLFATAAKSVSLLDALNDDVIAVHAPDVDDPHTAALKRRYDALGDKARHSLASCTSLRNFLKEARAFLSGDNARFNERVAHYLMGKLTVLPKGLPKPQPDIPDEVKNELRNLLRTHRYGIFGIPETPEKTIAKLYSLDLKLLDEGIDLEYKRLSAKDHPSEQVPQNGIDVSPVDTMQDTQGHIAERPRVVAARVSAPNAGDLTAATGQPPHMTFPEAATGLVPTSLMTADTNVPNASIVVQDSSGMAVKRRGENAKPQDYFGSIWPKIDKWFTLLDGGAARELLGYVLREGTSVDDRLTCLDNLRHLALGHHKTAIRPEVDGDIVSLVIDDVFTMTLNRPTGRGIFQSGLDLPD
ncbi:hypothetical protein AB870_25590 (plasmid) [Pandoraea faecigallinarum]|uniref:Uncharacterized protein n=1 Tax=Pandoraea faecigallinarum TaxID=656179 RepID=A0A0H3X469_9BURK|nr:hypothetical protein [Pandoraea faecigallinarum]AKM33541.1 hypothetical protein AB870_25590 [Pandoraea faecigallinarum]